MDNLASILIASFLAVKCLGKEFFIMINIFVFMVIHDYL